MKLNNNGYRVLDLGGGKVGIVFDMNEHIAVNKGEVTIAKTPPSGEFIAVSDERFLFMRLEVTEPASIREDVKKALKGGE
jgi:hypothetical protein